MYIESVTPELINLSVCLSVCYEDDLQSNQSGIFARYGSEYIPVLTEGYLQDIMGDADFPEYPFMCNPLEDAITEINKMLIDTNRTLITHYDIFNALISGGKNYKGVPEQFLQKLLTQLLAHAFTPPQG